MLEFNIVQQLAAVGLVIMIGIWARQKYQEKKKGANAKAGQSCSTCA
jgi:DNA-binding transcriptional regulator/RsmH inhibitor MraZ